MGHHGLVIALSWAPVESPRATLALPERAQQLHATACKLTRHRENKTNMCDVDACCLSVSVQQVLSLGWRST